MGIFRFLFKWSLEITGSLIVGYHYGLKPQQQANLYGLYRSSLNSYRTAMQVYAALNQYKGLLPLKENVQEYNKQLSEVNNNTAHRLEQLSRINKGVYMRLGQYIGHLKYAFPAEIYTVLKQLNDKPNYQAEQYKYLKKHIEAQLGKTTRQVFETLNTSPIKSELFYQVYKGQLAENFLDINLKVTHPYAKAEAKYDFWFLKKAFDYVENFKKRNFAENYPLYLDLLYTNLKNSVQKQLNLVQQQRTALEMKQKLTEIVDEQKAKVGTRAFPVYSPYIYSQYTKQNIMVQEYFEGYHLSNADALFKENYNKKNVASDLIGIWNVLFEKNKILFQSYTPFDLFIRKSRANEQGQYQLCLLNLSQVSPAPEFIVQPYLSLWKDLISSKKINTKKPQQRVESIRKFYESLNQVYFSFFLKQNDKVLELAQKCDLQTLSQSAQLLELAASQLPKEVSSRLQQKKLLSATKSKQPLKAQPSVLEEYNNLRRAFELEYQPWKFETLFQTYKQIFREQKHFGVF